ncbi:MULTISPECIES: ABC transporter ATP-binding protein [Brucella/Ochrobactrum group]|jgi:multiple sugar transport system ATP-binding protein|uniref:ABC transporter ATP-binding protein n=1 Tax=Brucella pseudintermedia TaxID=370111 RepID=A0ABY5ULF7_9HYPH|nr:MULTISPECIES: ABC transporter ATP-binding protein [Brucella/Ochrobactrum group]KAB2683498.1 ABC transporter ATP-binding protein [Brucella pseudintermedia]MCO7726119.1 ABC transporter ATP-binding protein [Brucella intermedia]NKE73981.1 ABC transporter ATP-binding protein [Ochrobactrum sp. MC-1LL]TWG96541.1 maltose ABC transporter ATP-binding protein /trehalose ABC transporter ATP-binding protein [Ochrobactrum sp. J50]UWL62849.1 ABC transporter ATP-binding protein [Brucella pseudintermedia]
MAELQLRDVRKSFGNFEVIRGVDMDIRPGEFMVFVGPSGCGKSTLLRLIAGLEEITSGSLSIDGTVVNSFAPSKRGIAMVFQSYALYPHMTVYENMAFGMQLAGKSKDECKDRIHQAAEMLQLSPYLERLPRQLSGGQRQRVAIGRAIVRDPKVFLFDEPLSNLDAALRVATRLEIAKLHQSMEDTTMIYVTHDQVEAMTLADRICVLRDGRVEQIGTPLELYEKPNSLFVAGFIGSPKMNFLTGRYSEPFGAHTVGLRPEHLAVVPEGGRWTGQVIHTEILGSDTYVYIDLGLEEPLVVRESGVAARKPGETLSVSPMGENIHRFDEKGRAV